ncbi:MAG: hypothetical protein PHD04_03905 [Candidatus Pacebacteria bacterium]|nr:hypothetical protein [Candidatus Paceibacterota bacterium]
MKEPSTRFELVEEWFEKAAKTASARGQKDSALLWQDGLEHLRYLKQENDRLKEIIGKVKELCE